jgi:hypothetical protein
MRPNLPSYQLGQRPIVLFNRAPFIRGFLLGSVVALGAYVALYLCVWQESPSLDRISIAEALDAGIGEQTAVAIARAEEINHAITAYVESCGKELAGLAWSEAGAAEERYQLLSSFMPFSPDSLEDYMPEQCEIVLWDDLGQVGSRRKVDLLVAGDSTEY